VTIPSLECLLQDVEGLVEPAHQVGVSGVNEVGGLAAIDCLRERVVEEGVLKIQMVNSLVLRERESKVRTVHMVAGLVHIGALGEPPEDPTSLIPV
jgi:hypothetical protein